MKRRHLQYPSTQQHVSSSPFSSLVKHPELDASIFCTDSLTSVYQSMIAVLRWVVELGQIDIYHEASLLSQYLVQPRGGHLAQVYDIFQCLKGQYTKGYVVMDPMRWDISWSGGPDEIHPWQHYISI